MKPGYVFDRETEKLFLVGELFDHVEFCRKGKKPHLSAPYRWVRAGKRAADGSIVRLPTIGIAGVKCTSVGAFRWWSDRLADGGSPPTPARTTEAHNQAAERAERASRELAMAGI